MRRVKERGKKWFTRRAKRRRVLESRREEGKEGVVCKYEVKETESSGSKTREDKKRGKEGERACMPYERKKPRRVQEGRGKRVKE